jgi:hypothetical protein
MVLQTQFTPLCHTPWYSPSSAIAQLQCAIVWFMLITFTPQTITDQDEPHRATHDWTQPHRAHIASI